jgi:hypothetical protein
MNSSGVSPGLLRNKRGDRDSWFQPTSLKTSIWAWGTFHTGQNVDCTDGKIRISPTINTIAMPGMADGWVEFFGAQDSNGADYVFAAFNGSDTTTSVTKIETSTYTIKKTTQILGANNASPGQHWIFDDSSGASLVYVPWDIAATNAMEELTTVATDSSDDTWTPSGFSTSLYALLGIQDGGISKLLRVQRNAIQACSAGNDPRTEANWSSMVTDMGDRTAASTGALTSGGNIFVGKRDTLYQVDANGQAFPFLDQSLVDRSNPSTFNGRGMWLHGSDKFYYPHVSALWEVSGGTARPEGIDQILGYTDTPNITIPRRYRHYGGCSRGDWNYCIYSDQSTNSYIMAFRKRKTGEPASAVNLWHPIIYRANHVYGIWMDNTHKLWWGEANNNRICYAQLASDGSPNTTTNRGAVNTTYPWYSKAIDFGYPTTLKELHRIDVYTENWPGAADCTIQPRYLKDGALIPPLKALRLLGG